MRFYEFVTSWERAEDRRHWPSRKAFYGAHRANALRLARQSNERTWIASHNQLVTEEDWLDAAKPYYKLWPAMAVSLSRTRLDIPVELIKSPFKAFVVRLPEEPIFDFMDGGTRHWIRTLLVARSYQHIEQGTWKDVAHLVAGGEFTVWFDIGERDEMGQRVFGYQHLDFGLGETVEDIIKVSPDMLVGAEGVAIPPAIAQTALQLGLAVCFLATGGSRVLERDILKRDREKYARAAEQPETRKRIEERAVRRGVYGWHIGQGRDLQTVKERGLTYEDAMRAGSSGRTLFYSHIRGLHWHTYRYGPGRTKKKVVLLDDIEVRPDLPPAPVAR